MTEISVKVLELKQFAQYLKPRLRESNKGNFGHVLIVGGDLGYAGAVRMAGEAALRVGAGLVSVATRAEHAMVLNSTCPELMCYGINSKADLDVLIEKATIVIVGPGMGHSTWAQKLLSEVLKTEKYIVVDADGLNQLAKKPFKKLNWILTPHPGEVARLLKKSVTDVQKDRLAAVMDLQKYYGGVCVLKGRGTLIMGKEKTIALCQAGNPGMATGGMGDVLSGVIGGLLAQGLPMTDAAQLGVLVHAMAGDLAAKNGGERGMIATDLFPFLRKLVN